MNREKRSVLQDWVHELSFMQQSVLLTAIRGPDGVGREHIVKQILRWFRRCVLVDAFVGKAVTDPHEVNHGGTFTGALGNGWTLETLLKEYFRYTDELPFHFQTHLYLAAEIIGYKHPRADIAQWWLLFYHKYVNHLHLNPETEKQLDSRLGDREEGWKAAETRAGVL